MSSSITSVNDAEERAQLETCRVRFRDAINVLLFLAQCKKTYTSGENAPALRILLEDKQVEIQAMLNSVRSGGGQKEGLELKDVSCCFISEEYYSYYCRHYILGGLLVVLKGLAILLLLLLLFFIFSYS